MLAAVTLQGTVRPQIFLAMEVMGLSRDFVSLHCKKCGFTLDASKVYHWLRQGSGAARSWDEILTLLMPQGGGQDFSLGLLFPSNAPCFNNAGWRLPSLELHLRPQAEKRKKNLDS